MGPQKRIFIHAGAHRTGTSSFQLCLHENRAGLQGAGYDVSYPNRDGIPSGDLALHLPSPRHHPREYDKFAARISRRAQMHSPDPSRAWIISEENIPGRMLHFFGGQFYPAAESRFDVLRQGLGDSKIERIVLVIRPYAEVFVSAHRKRAEDNWVDPFATIRENLMAMDRGWPELIRAMRDILRPQDMRVVSYSNRGASVDVLTRLVPDLMQTDLREPELRVNTSATDAALKALQLRYARSADVPQQDVRDIVAQHAQDRSERGFARFTTAQEQRLAARYADSLDAIAKLDGVTLDA